MSDHVRLVQDFISAWNAKNKDEIMDAFAPDCVYHNIPMEPMKGVEAIDAFISGFIGMANEIEWIVHHIAEGADGSVLTERTDRFFIGEKWIEIRVMGTFEIEDDKIKGWRDYFDLAEFNAQMAPG